jgi:hypothetical protein
MATVSFKVMIECQVRELVAEVMAPTGTRSLAEQVDDIAELNRADAMIQAALSVRMAAFAETRRRNDEARGAGADEAGRGASTEIALARRVSRATVDNQLAFAGQLVDDFPHLLAACLDGKVSQPAAKIIVKECEVLTAEQRRAVDAELTELAMQRTLGQLRSDAARKVAAVDPDAAARRARLARANKHVRAIMNGDGTATLSAVLPAEQAVAAWQALDHTARGMRGDGDERSISHLMADLLVERVTGASKATNLNLEVGVVTAASSLLGVDDQPGKLIGHNGGDCGALPADVVRQLANSENAWWRRLVCDRVDGRLLSMDTRRRRFTGTLRRFVRYRDGVSRRPYSNRPIYDIDHIIRHADDGPTSARNGEGLAKHDHILRDLPGWSVTGDGNGTVTWTTPSGHTYTSRPPPILGYGSTPSPRRQRLPIVDMQTYPVSVEYLRRHGG